MSVVLTIAGSDSGGGAGIQADLKTFEALGVFGTSALTATTAQNTTGVKNVYPLPAEHVSAQVAAVCEDMDVQAVKIGMVPNDEICHAIVKSLRRSKPNVQVVVDPVMISASGDVLSDIRDVDYTKLSEIAAVVTPNLPEALSLLKAKGHQLPMTMQAAQADLIILNISTLLEIGKALLKYWPAVLLKGGHALVQADKIVDMLFWRTSVSEDSLQLDESDDVECSQIMINHDEAFGYAEFQTPRLYTKCLHGTGCTLSAALASYMASGFNLLDSTRRALEYVHGAIAGGYAHIGNGEQKPLKHRWRVCERGLPPQTPKNPHPFTEMAVKYAGEVWDAYVNHLGVKNLADLKVEPAKFKNYIVQDYHYLKYYLRLYALMVYKDDEMVGAEVPSVASLSDVYDELRSHKARCLRWETDPETEPEAAVTSLYGRYILDTASAGSLLEAKVVAYACLYGYGVAGKLMYKRCQEKGTKLDPNEMQGEWLLQYSGEAYWQTIERERDALEAMLQRAAPTANTLTRLFDIFKRCTQYEVAFFDQLL